MKLLDARTSNDLVKLTVFIVVTSIFTALLVVLIGNLTFGASRDYKAEFVDATGVVKGDDVRIAGVKVGAVKEVEIVNRTHALVTFSVSDDAPVTQSTFAQIKYRNLVGQRYIALTQQVGSTAPMEGGETIPVSRTRGALDLTVLFNGFKPLFEALTPADLNQLSFEIVQVFQGEGGTLEGLLGHTASVTSTLASRDKVIGQLIDNLNEALAHIGERDDQLSDLIVSFRTLVGGLSRDRQAILSSLDSISQLSVETASLVAGIRPAFVEDITRLRGVAKLLDDNSGEISRALKVLPIKLNKVGRTAIYGSWFNFYLCQFTGRVVVGGQTFPVDYQTDSSRCNLG